MTTGGGGGAGGAGVVCGHLIEKLRMTRRQESYRKRSWKHLRRESPKRISEEKLRGGESGPEKAKEYAGEEAPPRALSHWPDAWPTGTRSNSVASQKDKNNTHTPGVCGCVPVCVADVTRASGGGTGGPRGADFSSTHIHFITATQVSATHQGSRHVSFA